MGQINCNGVCTVASDPDFKQINDNFALASASLVFNRRYKRDNEWQEEATFVKSKILGTRSERFNQLVKKGTRLYVQGYLTQETWKDKEGKDRSALVFNIQEFEICEKPAKLEKTTQAKQESAPKNSKVATKTKPVAKQEDDDEMPF